MNQRIEVVRVEDEEKKTTSLLFHHDGLTFDLFFGHILSSEVDQEILVVGKEGKSKDKIAFCKVFSVGVPRSNFFYKGILVEALHSFQFAEGDILSFDVRDGGMLADNGLREQLKDYYVISKNSPLLATLSSKAMRQFSERLYEARRTHHIEAPEQLIFRAKSSKETAWK